MENKNTENEFSWVEYPFLVSESGDYKLLVDVRYWKGFYFEVWEIVKKADNGYLDSIYKNPYPALVKSHWRKLTS